MEKYIDEKHKYSELTDKIIKAYYNVYNTLGYGFLEKVYENALMVLLRREGIKAEQQTPGTVYFEGQAVGDYYADILVENKIILEFQQCPVRFLRVLFHCSKAVIPACSPLTSCEDKL